MARAHDRLRSGAVLATAIAEVVSAPVTSLALGPAANQGAISDANLSPVTRPVTPSPSGD